MTTRERTIMVRAKQKLTKELRYALPASRPKKILFDHLPKCGGTSLRVYLQAHYPIRKTFSTDASSPAASVNAFKLLSQRKRHGYDLVKGHLAHELLDYVHPEVLRVTVLREPVDRIISHYYYASRTPVHYLYPKIHEAEMSLEDYATSDLDCELRNWYTTHFSGLSVEDAERNPEASIASAVDVMLNGYDIIGFLDDFSSFAETLRDQANLRCEYRNRRDNVTQERPSVNKVAPSTIRTIEQVNHLDTAVYSRVRNALA